MAELTLIVVSILLISVLIGIIVALAVWKKKKKGELKEPNYYAFFVLGMVYLPIGVVLMISVSPAFIAFMGLGICYMAIGLAHRDTWETQV